MNLRAVSSHKDWKEIKKLYMEAFPKCERKPLQMIKYKYRKNAADVWVIEDAGEFAGLAITMNGSDMELLGYHCDVSYEEYRGLYISNYGKLAERNVM